MYTLLNNFSAVILADGEFPTHQIPLDILHQAHRLICCDGALFTLYKRQPQETERLRAEERLYGVGDGDSLPAELKAKYEDIFHHVVEQEDNDLTKATRFVMEMGKKRIAYLGATGKREDHTLANIALMVHYYRDLGLQPVMITDYGWFVVAEGDATFDAFPRQQVSIFNISCQQLQSRGLKWDIFPFKELWQGTLNEAEGDHFDIDADGIYIVYLTVEAKSGKL